MLGVSERQARRAKSALIDDGYLGRIERANPRTRERWPDAVDLRPLFALLEACAFLYHGDELAHSSQPAWQESGPKRAPLDPDAFGQERRRRRQRRQAAGQTQQRRVIHSQGDTGDWVGEDTGDRVRGTWMSAPRRARLTPTRRTPVSPVTEQSRFRAFNQNKDKTEHRLQNTRLPGRPLRGPKNTKKIEIGHRAHLTPKTRPTASPATSTRESPRI